MNRRAMLVGGTAVVLAGAGAASYSYLQMGSVTGYDTAIAAGRGALPGNPDFRDLIRFATLAANSHNTQAWRFRSSDGRIEVLPDFSRHTPAVDPDQHHLFVSLGCAAENLALASSARGRPGELRFDGAKDGAAVFEFVDGSSRPSDLFDAIPHRQSTRAEYDGRTVSTADLEILASAAALPGVDVKLITDRPTIDRVRDLVMAGNNAQMMDSAFVKELKSWLRFNPRQALRSGDGLYSGASGSPILPTWLGPHMFDLFFQAKSENEKYARQLKTSPGVAVFVAAKADREHWILAGQACQRFALQATALGLKHAFINQPVEVADLRPELAALIGVPGRRPDLVMRYGYGPTLPGSPRRPVEDVIV
ncbi:Acg family FMN-binding oxidoreductase [Mesorhizobium sp. INR15]|uniref:Acg family FMN-binding oxidoreductase n=1 Tax=Mesorhizobium sp. INR15 TaxID=2654248 RepID=UPI0018966606|nr:nitroreductase family protein [Mesorhizobium sp. INR15]QPC91638.1 Tat pathway signal protein [Mesorhizobium sp. INR15]